MTSFKMTGEISSNATELGAFMATVFQFVQKCVVERLISHDGHIQTGIRLWRDRAYVAFDIHDIKCGMHYVYLSSTHVPRDLCTKQVKNNITAPMNSPWIRLSGERYNSKETLNHVTKKCTVTELINLLGAILDNTICIYLFIAELFKRLMTRGIIGLHAPGWPIDIERHTVAVFSYPAVTGTAWTNYTDCYDQGKASIKYQGGCMEIFTTDWCSQ